MLRVVDLPVARSRIETSKIKYAMLGRILARHERGPCGGGNWRHDGFKLKRWITLQGPAKIRHVPLTYERANYVERGPVQTKYKHFSTLTVHADTPMTIRLRLCSNYVYGSTPISGFDFLAHCRD